MAKPFDLEKTPFDVLEKRLAVTNAALDEVSQTLTATRSESITRRDVENGLIAVLGLDEITEILNRDIDAEGMLSLLSGYLFTRRETLCDITLQTSIIPDGVPVCLTEAEVKLRGEKWTIHKYDADPFPSNPHAHNYAQDLKLHLGNGALYSGKSKVSCGSLRKKDLMQLRDLVVQKNATIMLPPLLI